MHTTVFSGTIVGVDGLRVEVEVDISRGIPCFSLVGLPNTAVRESRERVTASIKNSGWEFPLERITVNRRTPSMARLSSGNSVIVIHGTSTCSRWRHCSTQPAICSGRRP